MDKRTLRSNIQKNRDAISDLNRALYSQSICEKLLAHEKVTSACKIASFMSFGSEVSTIKLNDTLINLKGKIALPRIQMPERKMFFHWVDDLATLLPSAYGILEPNPICHPIADPEDLDLIITPGVAFDSKGYRLGYGGGFYDKLFGQEKVSAYRLAIAFETQRVASLPTDAFDQPVKALITEAKVIIF